MTEKRAWIIRSAAKNGTVQARTCATGSVHAVATGALPLEQSSAVRQIIRSLPGNRRFSQGGDAPQKNDHELGCQACEVADLCKSIVSEGSKHLPSIVGCY